MKKRRLPTTTGRNLGSRSFGGPILTTSSPTIKDFVTVGAQHEVSVGKVRQRPKTPGTAAAS